MTASIAIGIDLGGTNLEVALVDREGKIAAQKAEPARAEQGPEVVIARMAATATALLKDTSISETDVVGVGVGVPGPLSPKAGRIIRSSNLPGWEDVPVRDRLADLLKRPVTVDNDGNAAAFGEFWVGAGRGVDDLVMLTLGTGVGAGVVLGARVLHGHYENAGELGHTIVVANGLPCSCGQHGCLEQYTSASAVARRVVAAINNGERCVLSGAVHNGETINGERVGACAKAGDPLCLRIWDEACLYLAIACIGIQHAYNPARIVLGGGMSEAGDFLLNRVGAHLDQQKWSLHDDLPTVTFAALGRDAGVIGAAGLVWQGREQSPLSVPQAQTGSDSSVPGVHLPQKVRDNTEKS